MLPPPIEEPISSYVPSFPFITNLTVLGWTSPKSASLNLILRPFSLAISKESLSLKSLGSIPNIPATNALSVPCPLYVLANDPCK